MRVFVGVILFLGCSLTSFAQSVRNVDFSVRNNKLFITYDLMNCPRNVLYDVSVTITDRQSGKIYPYSISGDVYKVDCGSGKEIVWDVLKDNVELKSEIKVGIKVEKEYSTVVTKGPSNVFWSMLLPGTGSLIVADEPSVLSLVAMGGYLYGAYKAISLKVEADNYYKNYTLATDQIEMNTQYELASRTMDTAKIYMGLAGAIWTVDVLYTLFKGISNRRKQLRYLSEFDRRNNFYVTATPAVFKVGWVHKF